METEGGHNKGTFWEASEDKVHLFALLTARLACPPHLGGRRDGAVKKGEEASKSALQ